MKKIILYIALSFSLFTSADDEKLAQKAFKAVFNGNLKLLSTCMTTGLDVHTTDTHGNTLLHTAVLVENPPIVRILLEHKANPHKKNNFGATPLSLSEELENTQIINMLTLDTKQSDPKIKTRELPSISDVQEETKLEESLWQAVKKGSYKKVETLLSIGADKYVNDIKKDRDRISAPLVTPLLVAIDRRHRVDNPKLYTKSSVLATKLKDSEYEQEENSKRMKQIREANKIIDILIRYADVNLQATNSLYSLPIILAVFHNLPHIVEKLAQAGANLSLPGGYTQNPLRVAIEKSYFEIIDILLKYKAPFTKRLNDYLVRGKEVPLNVLLFVYQRTGHPNHLPDTQAETKPKAPANNIEGKKSCPRQFKK